ncbi:MAG: 50S ribosomal protein L11 methyltransferase [Clostridiales bacterium]|nr:50S ribosomal protein L11 methyltransferase [Clostridiales bacterium]
MVWFELKIFTSHEAVEAVSNMLYQFDIDGLVIEDPDDPVFSSTEDGDWDYIDYDEVMPKESRAVIKGYVNKIDNYEEMINYLTQEMMRIKASGLDIGKFNIEINELDEKDWANEWKKYYKPFLVGKRLFIVPSWEKVQIPDDRVSLLMDPSGAFGSGTHETTFTCMEALEKFIEKDQLVFDIGCGSGILSIAAAKLGAKKVIGVDFSEVACETAIENAKMNGVDNQVQIIHGNLTDDITGKADIVVANIIADVIIEISDSIGDYIVDDGYFISSGIIDFKFEEVINALEINNFEIVETINKGEWYTIVSKKRL